MNVGTKQDLINKNVEQSRFRYWCIRCAEKGAGSLTNSDKTELGNTNESHPLHNIIWKRLKN
jgi:hypothetical protein